MLAASIHRSLFFFFFFKEWNSFYFCNLATQPAKKMNLMRRQPPQLLIPRKEVSFLGKYFVWLVLAYFRVKVEWSN